MIIALLCMIISGLKRDAFAPLRQHANDSFSPILSVANYPFQTISIFLHDVTGVAQLQADNKRLIEENSKLREWYQTALLLESENKSLRKLLNMAPSPEYDHIGARVLSDAGNTYAKSILVSAGENQGILKGAAVLAQDGLIGRVVEVSDKTSRILLVTDFNSRVTVVIENTSQHAIMAGSNQETPRLIHIPQESEIAENARVITSGYGGVYPHGLPVGRIKISPTGGYEVVLFANLDTLQNIKIIQDKKDRKAR